MSRDQQGGTEELEEIQVILRKLGAKRSGAASCKFPLFFPVWMVLAVSLSPAKHMSSWLCS